MTTAEDVRRVMDNELDRRLILLKRKVVRRTSRTIFWQRYGDQIEIAGAWMLVGAFLCIFWYGVGRAIDMGF